MIRNSKRNIWRASKSMKACRNKAKFESRHQWSSFLIYKNLCTSSLWGVVKNSHKGLRMTSMSNGEGKVMHAQGEYPKADLPPKATTGPCKRASSWVHPNLPHCFPQKDRVSDRKGWKIIIAFRSPWTFFGRRSLRETVGQTVLDPDNMATLDPLLGMSSRASP